MDHAKRPAVVGAPAPIPVLKQMAADPCDPRWGDKLVIVRGDGHDRPPRETREADDEDDTVIERNADDAPSPSASGAPSCPELAEFFEGDSVEFIHDGQDAFGEIVAIDAGRNAATVMLIPEGGEVEVSLDHLELVLAEEDEEAEEVVFATAETTQGASSPQGAAPPGKLFADPGEQKRLF